MKTETQTVKHTPETPAGKSPAIETKFGFVRIEKHERGFCVGVSKGDAIYDGWHAFPTMNEARASVGLPPIPDATQHTPGPWATTSKSKSNDIEPRHCTVTAPHADGGPIQKQIATVYYGSTDAERAANARLIAAAPELLAALQIAATTLETVYRERDPKNIAAKCAAERARAAIANAEGSAK